jgi:hypothetical protein
LVNARLIVAIISLAFRRAAVEKIIDDGLPNCAEGRIKDGGEPCAFWVLTKEVTCRRIVSAAFAVLLISQVMDGSNDAVTGPFWFDVGITVRA